jgi:putative DNA primase/helicase
MRESIEHFRTAIESAGIQPPEVIEPNGQLHRFATNGKPRDGWYVLYDDEIPAGGGHWPCPNASGGSGIQRQGRSDAL